MKRVFVVAVVIIMLLLLCSCGASSPKDSNVSSTVTVEEPTRQPEPTEVPTLQPTPTPTPEPTKAPIDVQWTEISYDIKDADGYTYKVTVKLTPWILTSENMDLIESIWSDIGRGNYLPVTTSDWRLELSSNNTYCQSYAYHTESYNSSFARVMNDMYYCLGTAKIQNTTEGWSIDSSSPRSVPVDAVHTKTGRGDSHTVCRTFFSSGYQDICGGIHISSSMKSNSWGPCTFVIMAPENITPNYPDGEYLESLLEYFFRFPSREDGKVWHYNGEVNFGDATRLDTDISIGVIGKGGEYIAPKSE